MIKAMVKRLGVVTNACKDADIDRSTHYDWMKADDAYREAIESIAEITLDFAESKLLARIDKQDITAIIFYLKTKGKKRGYVERQEIQHEVVIETEALTSARKRAMEILEQK